MLDPNHSDFIPFQQALFSSIEVSIHSLTIVLLRLAVLTQA